ncbi:MAG: endonuclease/exonuclease/phosphatase family protein [Phycisphaerae bacterium]|nr:endonuclease/exonuclease/phosphatase family protein [Phycisphaerae bacterium]
MRRTNTTLLICIVIGLAVGFYNRSQSRQFEPVTQMSNITGRSPMDHSGRLVIATWNIRGYPEKRASDRAWFTATLSELNPDIVCIQEIANQGKVNSFLSTELNFASSAFQESSDGQDNAIFIKASVTMLDLADPTGFQHPVQAVYVAYDGFDAAIVTVHLSWTNKALREREKNALQAVVSDMLARDPDLIINGDFNTTEQGIQALAQAIGMVVMVPAGQDGIGTTHANNRYDHFLVSPDLAQEEALSCMIQTFSGEDRVTARRVSDHLPVLATFRTDGHFRDRP